MCAAERANPKTEPPEIKIDTQWILNDLCFPIRVVIFESWWSTFRTHYLGFVYIQSNAEVLVLNHSALIRNFKFQM